MTARALRRIERDLNMLADESEIDPLAVRVAARRIGAQAEMLEEGLSE